MDGLLIHRVTIARPAVTLDNQGAPVPEVWNTVASNVPTLIQRMSGQMQYESRGMVFIPTHQSFFRKNTDLKVGDMLTDQQGIKYLVRMVDQMEPASNQIQCRLELMEGFRG